MGSSLGPQGRLSHAPVLCPARLLLAPGFSRDGHRCYLLFPDGTGTCGEESGRPCDLMLWYTTPTAVVT